MSTLTIPPGSLSVRDDAAQLHRAFKGFGCKTSAVIDILAHRDSEQRDLIQQEYETAFSETLTKRLSSELRGNLKKAILLWMHDPPTRDATIARQALNASLVDHQAIAEVICSRTPSQIRRFKETYLKIYHSSLESDIEEKLSGNQKKLLVAYVSTPRYEGPELNYKEVEEDAKELHIAGERWLGADEKTFIRIFSERSSPHLAQVSYAYAQNYGKSLEKTIKKETHRYFESGLLAILRCATNPALYFAKRLRKSMKGVGTDDSRLIRIIVSRTEVDMVQIKAAYFKYYGKPLTQAVRSDTSGHYKDFLLSLLGSDY